MIHYESDHRNDHGDPARVCLKVSESTPEYAQYRQEKPFQKPSSSAEAIGYPRGEGVLVTWPDFGCNEFEPVE